MAITIFSKAAGSVASFTDPTLPANTTLSVEGWGGFKGFKSIITRVNVAAQGNFQFLHTLGGNIYVYVFGDRVGQLGVSGLAFDITCNEDAGTIGIERVLDYYSENRIAARKTPLKITMGVKTTVAGYLVAVAGDVVDPKSKIYQFNLQFMLAPQSNIPCAVVGGAEDGEDAVEPPDADEPDAPADPVPYGTFSTYGEIASSVDHDGSVTGSRAIVAPGYSALGTGPNVSMVTRLSA